jgi:hypothetical protein
MIFNAPRSCRLVPKMLNVARKRLSTGIVVMKPISEVRREEFVGKPDSWRLMENAQMQGIRDPKERGVGKRLKA